MCPCYYNVYNIIMLNVSAKLDIYYAKLKLIYISNSNKRCPSFHFISLNWKYTSSTQYTSSFQLKVSLFILLL